MLNQCVLVGNLGDDPAVFFTHEGSPITSFNIAFQSSPKKTGWIKITCFNKLGEIAAKYLTKGSRVAVTGVLDQHKWQTDDGQNRSTFQIIATNLEFIKVDYKDGEIPNDDIPF
jgi:single-strand DNA-binding protein